MQMTIKQIMNEYGITRQAVFLMIKSGRLKARKVSEGQTNCWLIQRSDFEDYRNGRYKQARRKDGYLIFDKEKGLFSIREAADYVSCGVQHMYYLVRNNKIASSRIGSAYVIHRDELDLYVERERYKKTQEDLKKKMA